MVLFLCSYATARSGFPFADIVLSTILLLAGLSFVSNLTFVQLGIALDYRDGKGMQMF